MDTRPTNNGRPWRITPNYAALGADEFKDLDGCVCRACRRARLHRRHDDRAETRKIARRLALLCLAAAAFVGVLYGLGELNTFAGVW